MHLSHQFVQWRHLEVCCWRHHSQKHQGNVHHIVQHTRTSQVMMDDAVVYVSSCHTPELWENLMTSSHLDVQQLLASTTKAACPFSSGIRGIGNRSHFKWLAKTFYNNTDWEAGQLFMPTNSVTSIYCHSFPLGSCGAAAAFCFAICVVEALNTFTEMHNFQLINIQTKQWPCVYSTVLSHSSHTHKVCLDKSVR